MNSKQQAASDFAQRIRNLGFRVWIAERGTYGFISDESGERVLSFSIEDGGSLGGNYGPPSKESGTGWRLEQNLANLQTAFDVNKALTDRPPSYCGKGWKYLTTVTQYLKSYAASSNFAEVESNTFREEG